MADARRTGKPTAPAELDALAVVTPEDIERAKVAAQRDGSVLFNAILDARDHVLQPRAQP